MHITLLSAQRSRMEITMPFRWLSGVGGLAIVLLNLVFV